VNIDVDVDGTVVTDVRTRKLVHTEPVEQGETKLGSKYANKRDVT
jgi:hypothetical protein